MAARSSKSRIAEAIDGTVDLNARRTVPLNETERLLFEALLARNERIQREHIEPLRQSERELIEIIFRRAGLPDDALNRTHRIDLQAWAIVPLGPPPEPALPAEAGEA